MTSQSPQPECSARRFTAFPLSQYPLASPPSARPRSTCALRCPCARPFLSHQGQPPSRGVRRSVSPSAFGPAPASRTNARRWGAPLLYRGALLRCPVGVPVAVRYGTPRVTPTRYDGEGPVLPCAVAWTCRCARSVQRDPASPGRGDASPGPGGRYGVGVARVSEVVHLRLSGVRVRRSACTYTGRSRPAAPPGHAPVPGMTLAFAPTQRVVGSCGETWGWSNRERAQRTRSRPVDRYDMCIVTGKPAPRPPRAPRLPPHHPGVRTHDRDAPSVRYDGAGSVGRRTPGSLAVAPGSSLCPVVVVERAWSRSGTVSADMRRQPDRYPSPARGREPGGVAPSAQVPRSERTSPARPAVPVMLDQGRRGSCAVPLRQDRSCVRGVPSFHPWRSTDRARRVEQHPPELSLHPRSLVRRHGPTARPTLPPDGRPSPGPSRRAPVPVQHRPTDPGFTFPPRSEPSARAASANVRPTARPARPERSSRCRPANPVEVCQGTSVGLAQILGAARLGSCRRRRR